MKFNVTVSLIATIVVVIGLYLLYQRRTGDERYLALKLVGYYLLGSCMINVHNVPVPFGIGICLAFFHPKANAAAKRYAAFFGLLVVILGHLFPA